VIGQTFWMLKRSARTWISCSATRLERHAIRSTQLTVGLLLLKRAMRFSARGPHTCSIISHSSTSVTIQLIWLSGRREVQNLPCQNLNFPVSSSSMQVKILNAFSHSNAGKPLSCRRTDSIECHNNLLTLEAAHHGHQWHFHRPS
jgi:hypothetical protein